MREVVSQLIKHIKQLAVGKNQLICSSIKRNIPHLCRDFTPPRQLDPGAVPAPLQPADPLDPSSSGIGQPALIAGLRRSPSHRQPIASGSTTDLGMSSGSNAGGTHISQQYNGTLQQPNAAGPSSSEQRQSTGQIPLYSDPNFPPAWPLLTDTAGPVTYGDVKVEGEWGAEDDTELGALRQVAICF